MGTEDPMEHAYFAAPSAPEAELHAEDGSAQQQADQQGPSEGEGAAASK